MLFRRGFDQGSLRLVTSDDGGCLLLDIRHDRVLALNRVATDIWSFLCKGWTRPEIVESISRKYGVAPLRVEDDFEAFLRQVAALRLAPAQSVSVIASKARSDRPKRPSYAWYGATGSAKPEPKRSTVIAAIVGLALFDLIIAVFSLRTLCLCVNAWRLRKRKSDEDNIEGKVCSAVEKACVCYPRQALCLQRSAVTTCILKSYGVAARMVIGLRPLPVLAHAWVEVDGAPINDWRSVDGFYQSAASF